MDWFWQLHAPPAENPQGSPAGVRGGFIRRPWDEISTLSMAVARNYATVTIPQFKRNALRKA